MRSSVTGQEGGTNHTHSGGSLSYSSMTPTPTRMTKLFYELQIPMQASCVPVESAGNGAGISWLLVQIPRCESVLIRASQVQLRDLNSVSVRQTYQLPLTVQPPVSICTHEHSWSLINMWSSDEA